MFHVQGLKATAVIVTVVTRVNSVKPTPTIVKATLVMRGIIAWIKWMVLSVNVPPVHANYRSGLIYLLSYQPLLSSE